MKKRPIYSTMGQGSKRNRAPCEMILQNTATPNGNIKWLSEIQVTLYKGNYAILTVKNIV